LHDEEIYNLCFSPNVITIINSKTLRRAERIGRIGKLGNIFSASVENPEKIDNLGDLGVDGKVILNFFLKK
jgi:hypothetical protein